MPGTISYEEQQKELRKIQGYDDEEEDSPVRIPQDPEVNPEVYRDVEPYLFRGFLTQTTTLNEGSEKAVSLVFKTVNHHEHELIRLSGGYGNKGEPTPQFWQLFLSYSLLMVGGVNILPERDQWLLKLSSDLFRELPSTTKGAIIRSLGELNRRASRAVALTECYVLEKYSRYRWYQVHGFDLTSTSLTGIPGTQQLGMNWAQLIWTALNRIEDRRDSLEQDWEHAKFIGSCFGNKGVQKVYRQDARRKREEREERLAKKDSVLKHILLGEPLRDGAHVRDGVVWVTARTNEELIDQMNKDLRKEKDLHDYLVESFEQQQQESKSRQMQMVRTHREKRIRESQARREAGGKTPLRGYSLQEVQAQVAQQKQSVAVALEKSAQEQTASEQNPSKIRPVSMRVPPRGRPFGNR